MRIFSEKYTNSSKYYLDETDFFSTETITVPIVFRLFAITQLRLSLTTGQSIRPSATGAKDKKRCPYDATIVMSVCF